MKGPPMRPEAEALHVLSTTRAKAKMFEFRVPLEDHIQLPRNPDILFSLAVRILGDGAAALADDLLSTDADQAEAQQTEQPTDTWNPGDTSLRDVSKAVIGFAATYFDAFLGSRLNPAVTDEFSL